MGEPLDCGLNVAIMHIAAKLFPTGFDISADAPPTYEALVFHLNHGGRMVVYSGGSDDTIYGCRETNYCFRAWHDWCHWRGGYPFTPAGELAAYIMQCDHILTLYGHSQMTQRWFKLLQAEVIGQADYLHQHGHFPERQTDFVRAQIRA